MEEELGLANLVQCGFVPANNPDVSGYSFDRYYQPASRVGGDYYDFIPLLDGRLAVVVSETCGHGLAAANLNVRLRVEIEYCFARYLEPSTAITLLNERLCAQNGDRFVTLLLVVLEPTKHQAVIVNAGHPKPLWRRCAGPPVASGEDCVGMPLGIADGFVYQQSMIEFSPGESLTLFTDGVIEAQDSMGEQYSLDRLRRVIQVEGSGAQSICQAIASDIRRFMAGASPQDDLCIVCLGRNV